MQEWMRKHRRLIMFFILVFIGFPFVFMFGVPTNYSSRPTAQDNVVAQVGDVPILESEFRRSLDSAVSMRRGQGGDTPTYQQLDEDGTVQRVLENMVDASLIRLQEEKRGFEVDRTLLSTQMQQWDMFKDDEGNFNREAWNEWVGSVERWDEIYDDVSTSIGRQIFLSTVTAPAGRALEKEVEQELKADRIKLRVKHAKIEPTITPTEEEIKAHFDANPEMYRNPEKVNADVLALSLAPPMPEIAPQIVERARKGEDFAELAKQYSNLSEPVGGEMGWRTEEEFMADHLKPLFALHAGEISDPVAGPPGYFIYKNEEERANPDTGAREVLGRQIVLNAELSAAEISERENTANKIAERLEKGEDVQAIASEFGLELKNTGLFDKTSPAIPNIPDSDLFTFRSQATAQKDTPWKPIKCRNNIYLTRVTETQPGEIPAFEEVHDKARDNVIAERKRTDEYKAEVSRYADRIKAEAKKLEDVKAIFPELNVTIGETQEPFTRKDSLFQYQIYVQATEIHEAFKDSQPGDLAGPLGGFFGEAWFFELVERTDPSEEELAGLEGERETVKERLKQTAQYELMMDYTKDLRERMLANVSYQQNAEVMDRILGRGAFAPEEGEGEAAAAADAPVSATEGEVDDAQAAEPAAATSEGEASGSGQTPVAGEPVADETPLESSPEQ